MEKLLKNANVHFAALEESKEHFVTRIRRFVVREIVKKNVMNSLRTGIPVSQGIFLRDLSCSNDN